MFEDTSVMYHTWLLARAEVIKMRDAAADEGNPRQERKRPAVNIHGRGVFVHLEPSDLISLC